MLQSCYTCKVHVYNSKSLSNNIFSFPTQKDHYFNCFTSESQKYGYLIIAVEHFCLREVYCEEYRRSHAYHFKNEISILFAMFWYLPILLTKYLTLDLSLFVVFFSNVIKSNIKLFHSSLP